MSPRTEKLTCLGDNPLVTRDCIPGKLSLRDQRLLHLTYLQRASSVILLISVMIVALGIVKAIFMLPGRKFITTVSLNHRGCNGLVLTIDPWSILYRSLFSAVFTSLPLAPLY